MKLWLCEKPSQAKAVAARIGVVGRGDGFIDTKDGKVTWCFGHMLGIKSPGDHNEKWKTWSIEALPIIPNNFELAVSDDKIKQTKIIGKLLKESDHVVIATDGDREGELLGREILDYFNWSGNIERMWNRSIDDESIDKALKEIFSGSKTESLYIAGQARAESDYICGMTLSRAATLCFGNGEEVLSIGRVQTAVLGMIVRRDNEIENFIPNDFFDLKASLTKDGESYTLVYSPKEENRILEKLKADEIKGDLTGKEGVLSVEKQRKKTSPPKLFSLLTLQKLAHKKYKFSASKTKNLAQELYDLQFTSYPRTDCEFLPNEQEKDAERIIDNLKNHPVLSKITNQIGSELNFRNTVFNSEKITAHHAIVPTVKTVNLDALSSDQRKIYDLIAERYLLSFLENYEFDLTTVKLTVDDFVFSGKGSVTVSPGWKLLFNDDEDDKKEEDQKFPGLSDGETGTVESIDILSKVTKPRPSYTEATILDDMKSILNFTDDPEIIKLIKLRIKNKENAGIGAPATRDSYIDILLNRKYIEIIKNKIYSTETARKLISALPSEITDPIETCILETNLDKIANGEMQKKDFMNLATAHTTKILEEIIEKGKTFVKAESENPCPECSKPLLQRKGKNGRFWACSGYPDCKFSTSDIKGKPAKKEKPILDGSCPDCAHPLVKREGFKKGSKKEKYCFWGCSGFPNCKKSVPDKDGKPDIPEKSKAV